MSPVTGFQPICILIYYYDNNKTLDQAVSVTYPRFVRQSTQSHSLFLDTEEHYTMKSAGFVKFADKNCE